MFVRVAQPPPPGAAKAGPGAPSRAVYRLARVSDVFAIGESPQHYYNPWKGREALAKGIEQALPRTNRVLGIAFGSSTDGPDGKPRRTELFNLSDGDVTAAELAAYALRIRRQYEDGGDLADRLPSLGEALKKKEGVEALLSGTTFDAGAVARSLALSDRFLDVRRVANLTRTRDLAVIALDKYREEGARAQARGDGEGARRAKQTVAFYQARLKAIDDEQTRRREKARRSEAAARAAGKNVSALTSFLNAKAADANRAAMERISDDLRGKSAAQLEADMEDNPYMRRRTIPQNLWSVPGQAVAGVKAPQQQQQQQAAATAAAAAAPAAAVAPFSAGGATAAAVDMADIFGDAELEQGVGVDSSSSGGNAEAGDGVADMPPSASPSAASLSSSTSFSAAAADGDASGNSSSSSKRAPANETSAATAAALAAGISGIELLSPSSAAVTSEGGGVPAAGGGSNGGGAGSNGGGRKSISLADFRKRLTTAGAGAGSS